MMNLIHVVGARPNFMKAAPVLRALASREGVSQKLVHTGQHYDANMSDIFFQQLGMPQPDINLEVGSGSHAVQTAEIMTRFEEVVRADRPDWVLVYGDVNSTVAAALVCAKLGIPVAHVEAGLRSFDRRMPEEINRLVTDQLSDLLFTPSMDGNENLQREGIDGGKVHLVGNVMIDSLLHLLPEAEALWPRLQETLPLDVGQGYGLVTLHRPSNVDSPQVLRHILTTLNRIAEQLPLLFPIHPRTRQRIQALEDVRLSDAMYMIEPMGYLEFLTLQQHASLIITDSGGIQEETTYLGVPCLTLRENTERPVTVQLGTNQLIGQDMERLEEAVQEILGRDAKTGTIPPLWDGKASQRIADVLTNHAG